MSEGAGPTRSDALAPFELSIPAELASERIDRALAALRPEISRSTFQRWIDEGRVSAEGRAVRARDRAKAGMVLVVRPLPPPASDAVPQPMELAILFEDEHLVVLEKPAGLVVHPAPGHPDGTLVNGLLHRYAELATAIAPADDEEEEDAPRVEHARPGIVHRLDRDTSGVMVVARTGAAREGLMKHFAKHDIERAYLAIVEGLPSARTFDTLHGRHPTDRKRFTTRVTRGKRAVTHVEVVERLGPASLVRCTLETGRTHQIRVHLAEHGTPLLADATYGRTPRDPHLRKIAAELGRHALHAAVLGFVHPITGAGMRFETPLPADMQRALDALRAAA